MPFETIALDADNPLQFGESVTKELLLPVLRMGVDGMPDRDRVTMWAAVCSSIVGAMVADIGVPATDAVLDSMKAQADRLAERIATKTH